MRRGDHAQDDAQAVPDPTPSPTSPGRSRCWAITLVFTVTLLCFAAQLGLYQKTKREVYPTLLMPGFAFQGSTDEGVRTTRVELEVVFEDDTERFSIAELRDASGMGAFTLYLLNRDYPGLTDNRWDDLPEAAERPPPPAWARVVQTVYPTFRSPRVALMQDPARRAWLRAMIGRLAPGREPVRAWLIRTPVTVYGYGYERRDEPGDPRYHRVEFVQP
ncbi:MAG: hypothetical protein AAF797_09280 [Planctomycetota bacterium]